MNPPRSILFVCTGNACRSPMAEAIARHLLKQKGMKNIQVFSRGTHTGPGQMFDPQAGWVLTEAQIPFEDHTPRRLSKIDIHQAGLIFGMAREHVEAVVGLDPRAYKRTFLLQEYVNQVSRDIDDPIGQPLATFRKCRDELRSILEKWAAQLPTPEKTTRQRRSKATLRARTASRRNPREKPIHPA